MARFIVNFDPETGHVVGPHPYTSHEHDVGEWFVTEGHELIEAWRAGTAKLDEVVGDLIDQGHEWTVVTPKGDRY